MHLPIKECNQSGFTLRIEIRNNHIAIFPECCFDIGNIHVFPRAIHDMAVFLVLIVFTVHTTDGLNGIDAADFFVKEQRM